MENPKPQDLSQATRNASSTDKPTTPSTHLPPPKLLSIVPVFSTADLPRWLAHYRALGFAVRSYGTEYGFAACDGVQLHVAANPHHDPLTTAGCAYLYVDDADALHAAWSAAGAGGRSVAPCDTPYGLREGAHHDPDNNLLRYGSRMGGGGVAGEQGESGGV